MSLNWTLIEPNFEVTENGVIRRIEGRRMDRLNRTGEICNFPPPPPTENRQQRNNNNYYYYWWWWFTTTNITNFNTNITNFQNFKNFQKIKISAGPRNLNLPFFENIFAETGNGAAQIGLTSKWPQCGCARTSAWATRPLASCLLPLASCVVALYSPFWSLITTLILWIVVIRNYHYY